MPKKGNYSLLTEGFQFRYEISVLNLSELVAPLVTRLDPFRIQISTPNIPLIRRITYLREQGQSEFETKASGACEMKLDPSKAYEIKYNLELTDFPGIVSEYSPILTHRPVLYILNSFVFNDFLNLGGFLCAYFKFETSYLKIDLEVNLDGKNWIQCEPPHEERNRTSKETCFRWQVSNYIFDTLTRNTFIDWRIRYQAKPRGEYVAYSDKRRSEIMQRNKFVGKEFISDTLVFERSESDFDDGDGWAWTYYNHVYWNLYLFSTGGFLFIKEAENSADHEFYRTGNFTIHEPNDASGNRKLMLYTKKHNGKSIRQLKFEKATTAHPVFGIKDLAQLILHRYCTTQESLACARVCKYFYEVTHNNGGYAVEADIIKVDSKGTRCRVTIPAWGCLDMTTVPFISPKILEK
jgi:hypothetical protein